MAMELSVVIPTYNGLHNLKESIPKIEKACKGFSHEIIVADNASTDGTEEWLGERTAEIHYVHIPTNTGFTGACNAGAEKARGEFILFLNNDCSIDNDSLTKMIAFLKKSDKYVATQPVIYTNNGKTIEQIGFIVDLTKGKAKVVTDSHFFEKPDEKIFPLSTDTFHFSQNKIYGLSGTCLLIKNSIFKKLEMFDESFHSYLEDVELSIRMADKGYKYFPTMDASCTHQHMATSRKMGTYKQERDLINWIRILAKHYPATYMIRHFPKLLVERLRNANGYVKKVRELSSR